MRSRIIFRISANGPLFLLFAFALLGGWGNHLTAQSANSANIRDVSPAATNAAPLFAPPVPGPLPVIPPPTCAAPCVPTTNALPSNPNLQYFGVWWNGGSSVLPVSAYGNLVWVDLTSPNLVPNLAQIKALGGKAILFMSGFGWICPPNSSCPPVPLTLDPNFSSDLQPYVATLTTYADTIVAFYPYDEPFINDVSDGSGLASEIAQVKSIPAFSNWKAAVVFSSCEVNEAAYDPYNGESCTRINNGNTSVSAIPAGYDWVGVDCYTSFDDCDGHSIPYYLGVLSGLPNSPKKFIINPSATFSESGDVVTTPTLEVQETLMDDEELYMKYALGEQSQVVAISPFEFDNCVGGASQCTNYSWAGIQQMPEVQTEIGAWGDYISRANTYYPFKTAAATNVLANWPASNAIDGLPWTTYSSNIFPNSANPDGATYIQAMLDTTSTPFTVQNIALTARMNNGVALGFPQSYEILTSPDNSSWISEGYFPTQPNAAGVAIIQLPEPVQTYGVVVNPTILGTDNLGNYYFQLAEIGLQGPLGTAYSIPMTSAYSNNVLSGWPASNAIAGPTVCCYSSNLFPSSQNTTGAYLAAWTDPTAGPFHAQNVVLTARMLNGVPQAFPLSYEVFTTTTPNDNSSWTSQGDFSTQPNSTGIVTIPVPQAGQIYGVKILPLALGPDSYDNAYFQLAQIGLSGYY